MSWVAIEKGYREMFRLFHAVGLLHCTEALDHSNHTREVECLAIFFGWIASSIPWFLCSTAVLMQLSYQCRHFQCSDTTVQTLLLAVAALKQLTKVLDSMWLNEVTFSFVPPGISPKDNGAMFCRRVSGRLGMPGGKYPRHARNPLLGEWRKTLSTTHHMPYHLILKSSVYNSLH